MWREIERFTCKSDSGETYVVVATEDVLTFDNQSTGIAEKLLGGRRRFALVNGLSVTRFEGKLDTFKIDQTREIITRSDFV